MSYLQFYELNVLALAATSFFELIHFRAEESSGLYEEEDEDDNCSECKLHYVFRLNPNVDYKLLFLGHPKELTKQVNELPKRRKRLESYSLFKKKLKKSGFLKSILSCLPFQQEKLDMLLRFGYKGCLMDGLLAVAISEADVELIGTVLCPEEQSSIKAKLSGLSKRKKKKTFHLISQAASFVYWRDNYQSKCRYQKCVEVVSEQPRDIQNISSITDGDSTLEENDIYEIYGDDKEEWCETHGLSFIAMHCVQKTMYVTSNKLLRGIIEFFMNRLNPSNFFQRIENLKAKGKAKQNDSTDVSCITFQIAFCGKFLYSKYDQVKNISEFAKALDSACYEEQTGCKVKGISLPMSKRFLSKEREKIDTALLTHKQFIKRFFFKASRLVRLMDIGPNAISITEQINSFVKDIEHVSKGHHKKTMKIISLFRMNKPSQEDQEPDQASSRVVSEIYLAKFKMSELSIPYRFHIGPDVFKNSKAYLSTNAVFWWRPSFKNLSKTDVLCVFASALNQSFLLYVKRNYQIFKAFEWEVVLTMSYMQFYKLNVLALAATSFFELIHFRPAESAALDKENNSEEKKICEIHYVFKLNPNVDYKQLFLDHVKAYESSTSYQQLLRSDTFPKSHLMKPIHYGSMLSCLPFKQQNTDLALRFGCKGFLQDGLLVAAISEARETLFSTNIIYEDQERMKTLFSGLAGDVKNFDLISQIAAFVFWRDNYLNKCRLKKCFDVVEEEDRALHCFNREVYADDKERWCDNLGLSFNAIRSIEKLVSDCSNLLLRAYTETLMSPEDSKLVSPQFLNIIFQNSFSHYSLDSDEGKLEVNNIPRFAAILDEFLTDRYELPWDKKKHQPSKVNVSEGEAFTMAHAGYTPSNKCKLPSFAGMKPYSNKTFITRILLGPLKGKKRSVIKLISKHCFKTVKKCANYLAGHQPLSGKQSRLIKVSHIFLMNISAEDENITSDNHSTESFEEYAPYELVTGPDVFKNSTEFATGNVLIWWKPLERESLNMDIFSVFSSALKKVYLFYAKQNFTKPLIDLEIVLTMKPSKFFEINVLALAAAAFFELFYFKPAFTFNFQSNNPKKKDMQFHYMFKLNSKIDFRQFFLRNMA